MTTDDLLKQAREIWGKKSMGLDHVVIALGVTYGDLCRQARAVKEQQPVDEDELKKELGNVIFSGIRWCDELGFSPEECIELARQAQARYVSKEAN